jgi:hypothetical protein
MGARYLLEPLAAVFDKALRHVLDRRLAVGAFRVVQQPQGRDAAIEGIAKDPLVDPKAARQRRQDGAANRLHAQVIGPRGFQPTLRQL